MQTLFLALTAVLCRSFLPAAALAQQTIGQEAPSIFSSYDLKAEPLAPSERALLQAAGYRFDDLSGRVISPSHQGPATRSEILEALKPFDLRTDPRRYKLSPERQALLKEIGLKFDDASGRIMADGKAVSRAEILAWLAPARVSQEQDKASFDLLIKRGYRYDKGGGQLFAPATLTPITQAEFRRVINQNAPLGRLGQIESKVSAAGGAIAQEIAQETAPLVALKDRTKALVDYSKGRKAWEDRRPRQQALEAWQKLVDVKVHGQPLDQRFKIAGPAYYVSPSGHDADDGSQARPWRTLAFAVSRLKPNTVIYLKGGTYYGPVAIKDLRATAGGPAAIRGMDGEEVVVTYPPSWIAATKEKLGPQPEGKKGGYYPNGREAHYPPLIEVTDSDYVEISGLHLVGVRDELPHNHYTENGVSFMHGNSESCRVVYCEIENVGHCGIKGGSNCLYEGNYIHDVGQTPHDHGVYLSRNGTTMRKNIVSNSAGYGAHAYAMPSGLTISHNVFVGNTWHGVVMGGKDSKILNNFFAGNRTGGVFLFRHECKNNLVANNVFAERGKPIEYDGNPQDGFPTGNVVDYNNLAPGSVLAPPAGGNNRHGPHNIVGYPMFLNPQTGDYRLDPRSPLIDAGDPALSPSLGTLPDIGLHETSRASGKTKPAPLPPPAASLN